MENENKIQIVKKSTSVRPPRDDERCSATCKRTGERCQKYKVPGEKVCRFHGASLKNRIKHQLAINGKNVHEQIEKYKSSPELLNLSNQIALLKMMLDEYTSNLKSTSEFLSPEVRTNVNLMCQSIGNLILKLTQCKKNVGDYLDHSQLNIILKGVNNAFVYAVNQMEMTDEQKRLFLGYYFEKVGEVKVLMQDDLTQIE